MDACLHFDWQAAEQLISRAFAIFPPEIVCFELLRKGLSDVGERWFRGEIAVQQEHFASALSAQKVEMLIATEVTPFKSQRVLVINAPGDYHVFSPLLMTYLLRRRGWDVVYLGANVPAAELESALLRVRPDHVVASAQMLPQAADLAQMAVSIEAHDIPLAYGGLVFLNVPGLIDLFPG